MNPVSDASRRSRKKLPDIPPEELALHRDTHTSEAGGKRHDIPAEVIRHWHKRSRSLTGLDTVEFPRQQSIDTEKENLEPGLTENPDVTQNEPSFKESNANFARSLPSTPISSRKASTGSLKSAEEREELVKELRWHYKQFVKNSKRKKEKLADASVGGDTDSAPSLEGIAMNEVISKKSPSVIRTNRCDKCNKTVDILARVAVENHVFHKGCFVCAICHMWLNHFNYCFVPEHDKFYCTQHYQDVESASAGLGEEIRHAMGIGPGVQQQFRFSPDGIDSTHRAKSNSKVHHTLKITKEKIALLSKRGKKLEKKEKKLKSNLDKFKGPDLEKQTLWMEWFLAVQDKNSTMRREAELSFKVREVELSGKYTELEKKLREITEKDEHVKTEYDKSKEKELLQEMLEVVEKREQLISEVELAKQRYIEEDKELEKTRKETGFNEPDVIRDATALGKDAQELVQAVKQTPNAVKRQSHFLCPGCVLV